MTEYIAQVVNRGPRYRVALVPVSRGGASPVVAAAWAEQDGQVFEADSRPEAEAFIGQMPARTWGAASPCHEPMQAGRVRPLSACKRCGTRCLPDGQVECATATSAQLRCELGADESCGQCCGCRRMKATPIPAQQAQSKVKPRK